MSMQKLNKNIEKVYSLSPLQKGMLYHQMLNEKPGSYVVQTSLKIKGDFSVDLANESIQLLALQHEALRTMIPLNRFRKPVQIVLRDRIIEFNGKRQITPTRSIGGCYLTLTYKVSDCHF